MIRVPLTETRRTPSGYLWYCTADFDATARNSSLNGAIFILHYCYKSHRKIWSKYDAAETVKTKANKRNKKSQLQAYDFYEHPSGAIRAVTCRQKMQQTRSLYSFQLQHNKGTDTVICAWKIPLVKISCTYDTNNFRDRQPCDTNNFRDREGALLLLYMGI